MVDVASTQARAKGVAPFASREGGQTEAGAAKPMSASPLPTADGVDKMYRQLAEIHAITAAHLAEWAHWRRSDPTVGLVRAGTSCQRPAVTPSVARLAPSPPTIFSSQALLWWQGRRGQPQAHQQARQGSAGALHERRT
jgi:hypothetical protein